MAGTSSFPLADRATGGRLAELLTRYRDNDESFEAITFRLRADHGIVVSSATVRRWCIEIGVFVPIAERAV